MAQSGRKPGVTARLIRPRIGSNLVIAFVNEVVHNGGHKTKAGPLMKPYFVGFLGFPVPTAENPSLSASFFESYSTRFRAGHRAPQIPEGSGCSRPFGNNPSRKRILNPSPEAVDPASRRWRRYAEAPAAAVLTDLRIAVGPASRLRRRYADAPAAAFLVSFLSMPAVRLNLFI
jgi:hypothetical protein